jgi:hypothetical protein
VAFAFGAWGLQVGWSHGILDVHAWRQSHTAISAYEMAVIRRLGFSDRPRHAEPYCELYLRPR